MTFPFDVALFRSIAAGPLAAALLVACLTSAPVGAQTARPSPPPATSFKQFAPGLLVRQVFTSRGTGGRTIELWDLLVGPGQQSDSTRLPGAAVLEVRGGNGRIVVDGKPQQAGPGTMLSVPDGATVAFLNGRADHGLSIRAVITRRPRS